MSAVNRFLDKLSFGGWWVENFHSEITKFKIARPDIFVFIESDERPCMHAIYYIDSVDRKYAEFYCLFGSSKKRLESLRARLSSKDIKWLVITRVSDSPPIRYPFKQGETFNL